MLPLISEIMDEIEGAKYFIKFDVQWGYNNIQIKKEDQLKAAFKTNRGLSEPIVMFFGMCNSPATFQAMMDSIFSGMIEAVIYTPPPIPEIPVRFWLDSSWIPEFWVDFG